MKLAILEETGAQSMMRLMVLIVVVALVGVWSYLSCIKQEMQPIDVDKVILILGALGAKAIQKKIELAQKEVSG